MAPIEYGWKLFRVLKDGSLRSLFIDRARALPEGVWLKSKRVRTKGYAFRPGWHILTQPNAPHLSPKGRVMRAVAVRGVLARHQRPDCQGGEWITAREIFIMK